MRLEEHPVLKFKRPIYGVLVFYGVGVICFSVVAISYFRQRKEGEIWPTTKAAFWTLGVVLILGVIKLIWDLANPKTRQWMFTKKSETGQVAEIDPPSSQRPQ